MLTQAAGYLFAQRLMMPVLSALVLWPFLLWALRHRRIDIAWRLQAVWMLSLLLAGLIAGRMIGLAAQNAAPASIEYVAGHMRWLTGSDAQPPAGLISLGSTLQRFAILLLGSALSAAAWRRW